MFVEKTDSNYYNPDGYSVYCNLYLKHEKPELRLATSSATEGSEFESRYVQEFPLLNVVQTGSGVHPTSCLMSTGGSFPGGKAAGA
jgi:hypothetical protein